MRQIDGETKLVGLIGKNTNYTLSPHIHNASIKELGLNFAYVNFQLDEDKVSDFLKSFIAIGGIGLNVTKPYKTLVKNFCSHTGLNSINTLSLDKSNQSSWLGHSTDGEGFTRGLRRLGDELDQFDYIIVLGSGGAAIALVSHFLAAKNSLKKIFILQRRQNVFNDLVLEQSSFKKLIEFRSWQPATLSEIINTTHAAKTLMIQATSAPSHGSDLRDFSDAFKAFNGTFVDLVYDKPSALYFEALNRGLKTQDGLPMLIEQARLSQEIWWGKSGSYDIIAKALKPYLY